MEKRNYLKTAGFFALGAFGFFIFFRYIFSLLLPFIIALFIAFLLNYPIKILKKRTHINSKILSAILVTSVIFLLGFIIFLAVNRIISEAKAFFISLAENSDKYVSDFFAFVDAIAKKLPFIDAVGADLTDTVSEVVKGMLTEITSHLPAIIASFISMLPHILLFAVVIILASYYFSADFDGIKASILSVLPESARKTLHRFKRRLMSTGIKYLKACFILLFVTYFELLAGFLMLGIPYAFSLSLIVAAIDMLPIFGVGTVLVPWAIWEQITGNTYLAIGLIIIFAVVTVVRQFIEPKIISSGIGISPITTIFAMYIGFRLFGLAGLIFSPLVAVLVLYALPEEKAKKLGLKAKNAPENEKTKKE